MKINLEWNVFRYDINSREISKWNVFKHGGFYEDVIKVRRESKNKTTFSTKLRSKARYYFWSRCEYEIILGEWPPAPAGRNVEEKIDVYDQLDMNWEMFVDYLWRKMRNVK